MPKLTKKEQRLYTTVQVSDREYAKLATWATARGLTWGAGVRALIKVLPEVSDATVFRWMQYRTRSGHEKPLPSLEELGRVAVDAAKLDMTEEEQIIAQENEAVRIMLAARSSAPPSEEPVPSEIDAIFRRTGADKMKEPPASHVATEDQMRELRGEELTDLPLTKAQEEDLKRKRANEKKAKETEL